MKTLRYEDGMMGELEVFVGRGYVIVYAISNDDDGCEVGKVQIPLDEWPRLLAKLKALDTRAGQ